MMPSVETMRMREVPSAKNTLPSVSAKTPFAPGRLAEVAGIFAEVLDPCPAKAYTEYVTREADNEGALEGLTVGSIVGAMEGPAVGAIEGFLEGIIVVGRRVGKLLGGSDVVGTTEGALEGIIRDSFRIVMPDDSETNRSPFLFPHIPHGSLKLACNAGPSSPPVDPQVVPARTIADSATA